MNELKKRDTKDEKIKLCDYCHKQIISNPIEKSVESCIIERKYPSNKDFLKNSSLKPEDIIYHQDCYKEKCGIIDVNKLKERFRKSMIITCRTPKESSKV